MHFQEADPILVGSGELYIGQVAEPETATEATIQAALKNIGAIQAGATLTYSNEMQEINSANRGLIMRFMTSQKIEFGCGIMTWVMDNMALLCPGTVETLTAGDVRGKRIKIGKNSTLPINYLRFVHNKSDGTGDLVVNIYKATPAGGFELTFDQDNPLSIDYKFVALATDNGNLCEIVETEYPAKEVLKVSSIATATLTGSPAAGTLRVWVSTGGVEKDKELTAITGTGAPDEDEYKINGEVITVADAHKGKYLICEYYTS